MEPLDEKNRSGQCEVYEKLPAGQAVSRSLVRLDNTSTNKVADSEVPGLWQHQALLQLPDDNNCSWSVPSWLGAVLDSILVLLLLVL